MPGAEVRADVWISEYITPWDIYQHGVNRILASKRTNFQEMQIVETGAYGKALVLDGKWQSCTGDEFLYHEPLVHPAMIAHGNPKRVLILGGGEGATAREVLRWKCVERAVMVDIDGEVVAACREHLPEMHQGAEYGQPGVLCQRGKGRNGEFRFHISIIVEIWKGCKASAYDYSPVLLRHLFELYGVHAVAQPAGRGPVGEYMTEVGVARVAGGFHAPHAV